MPHDFLFFLGEQPPVCLPHLRFLKLGRVGTALEEHLLQARSSSMVLSVYHDNLAFKRGCLELVGFYSSCIPLIDQHQQEAICRSSVILERNIQLESYVETPFMFVLILANGVTIYA